MKFILCAVSILALSCSSHHNDPVAPPTKLVTDIHSGKDKAIVGTVTIEEVEKEFKVTTDIKGLKPNSKFGFHIHQNGVCEGPDYKSAGDHYNPHKMPHGDSKSSMRHTGDLGNLQTNAAGEAKQEILIPKIEGDKIDQFISKSILIHAGKDDLKSQPSGNSGDRIACGLIKPI